MNHLHQEVEVAGGQRVLEEIAALRGHPFGDLRLIDDVWLIEEHPFRRRRLVQDRSQQMAAAAADVADHRGA